MFVLSTIKVISSYNVMFDESFSSLLSYTSRCYSKDMAMHPAVIFSLYATSSREETGVGIACSVSFTRVICPCVVRKATVHIETKMLNMHH